MPYREIQRVLHIARDDLQIEWIDTRCFDADEHFAGLRFLCGGIADLDDLGATKGMNTRCLHDASRLV